MFHFIKLVSAKIISITASIIIAVGIVSVPVIPSEPLIISHPVVSSSTTTNVNSTDKTLNQDKIIQSKPNVTKKIQPNTQPQPNPPAATEPRSNTINVPNLLPPSSNDPLTKIAKCQAQAQVKKDGMSNILALMKEKTKFDDPLVKQRDILLNAQVRQLTPDEIASLPSSMQQMINSDYANYQIPVMIGTINQQIAANAQAITTKFAQQLQQYYNQIYNDCLNSLL